MINNSVKDYFSDKPKIIEKYEELLEKIRLAGNSIEFRDSYIAKKIKLINKLKEMVSTAYAKRDTSMFESLGKGIDAVIFNSEVEMYALYTGITELKKLKRDYKKYRKDLELSGALNQADNT